MGRRADQPAAQCRGRIHRGRGGARHAEVHRLAQVARRIAQAALEAQLQLLPAARLDGEKRLGLLLEGAEGDGVIAEEQRVAQR